VRWVLIPEYVKVGDKIIVYECFERPRNKDGKIHRHHMPPMVNVLGDYSFKTLSWYDKKAIEAFFDVERLLNYLGVTLTAQIKHEIGFYVAKLSRKIWRKNILVCLVSYIISRKYSAITLKEFIDKAVESRYLPLYEVRKFRRALTKYYDLIPKIDRRKYITRIVSQLSLPFEVERLSYIIYNALSKVVSATPPALAATSVYLATKALLLNVRQDEIAKAGSVTDQTIRNTLRKAEGKVEIIVKV